ncbi:MAG: pyruvate kinase [Chloroflexi bacterium]|jgi:pyruvate kinase|nr:pyruvate kinase [Chloroflexota bacterium]MCH2536754.1 pyruvate kinase [Dehalococcoidia bacterium]MEE2928189.1 pyruvate kinase [Chloroflexota bacterium]HIM48405.1 pyruvate kinase [Dehalococcoidia bacterium]|tara:strand:+ start:12547 stop:13992 length:1446 start_codon:yes stop_codon:yes gene_type:complete
MRKTKIIVTIGPASRDPEILGQLLEAGMDCARLNFSHGTLEEHGDVIRTLRELARQRQRPVAILQDLGGIKLRLGQMDGSVRLNPGEVVSMVSDAASDRPDVLPFPQPEVLRNLRPGHKVFISDGTVSLEVLEAGDHNVKLQVLNSAGLLSSFKGVNLPGVTIDQPVLTEADKIALLYGMEQQVDWVAVSFVRSSADIAYAKDYLKAIGSNALVMAKMERGDGIDNIDSILEEVDGVMVARGDMGVEIPMEQVPLVQKSMVKKANEAAKVSAIATQMLRSMVESPTPTRAEVSDITNAVLDGCDAILLSDETAMGQFPVETVKVAESTIRSAESIYPYHQEHSPRNRTQAVALAAGQLVKSLNSKPIVITSTGRAAFEVSRVRPENGVLVFSHDEAVLQKMCLGWGLYPIGVVPPERDVATLVGMLINAGLDSGMVQDDDVVTIVHGFLPGVSGTTNTIQVLDIAEYLSRSTARQTAAVAT